MSFSLTLIILFCDFLGMVLDKWRQHGRMDRSSLHSVQLDQERVTPTGLQFQDKKERCGGMHIVHGLEPLFTVPLLFTQKKDIPTHFLSQSVKQSSLLVYSLFEKKLLHI